MSLVALGVFPAHGAAAEKCSILLFAPNATPSAFSPDAFRREFARESLATSRCEVLVREADILNASRLVEQVDAALATTPSIIIAPGSLVALTVRARESRIPILFVAVASPEVIGLIENSAAPEANLTGLTYAMQERVKMFEVIRELVGEKPRIGVVVDRFWPTLPASAELVRTVRKDLGADVRLFAGDTSEEVLAEVRSLRGQSMDAWVIPDTPLGRDGGAAIVAALRRRPGIVIVNIPELLEAGAHVLMHPVIEHPTKTLAEMADLILRGVPLRRIPVVHPKRFAVAVNVPAVESTPGVQWKRLMAIADSFRYDSGQAQDNPASRR